MLQRRYLALYCGALLVSVVVILGCSSLWLLLTPRPAPPPYPGVSVTWEKKVPMGNCCSANRATYSIPTLPADLRDYYDNQMRQYCKNQWVWHEYTNENKYKNAWITGCTIRSWPLSQEFGVSLYFNDETETRVIQKTIWEVP